VLRHDHVAIDAHPETQSHGFQAEGKQVVEPGIGKFRFSPIAAEGDEVRLTRFVVAHQTSRHRSTLHRPMRVISDAAH